MGGNCTDDMEGFLSQTEIFMIQTRLDSWQRYVNGLRDYVYSLVNNAQRILFLLETKYPMYNIKQEDIPAMYDYLLVNGSFWKSLANLSFTIMEGVQHPKNLTHCDFMTSDEITFLLGVDVCDEGYSYTSLHLLCPVSCQCIKVPSMQCPPSCY